MFKAGLFFIALIGTTLAYECLKDYAKPYNYPNSANCRSFYHCDKGKMTEDSCFILFRKFDPLTNECAWAWNVDCDFLPHGPI